MAMKSSLPWQRTGPNRRACELIIATRKDHKQRAALSDEPPPRGRMPKYMTAREQMDRKCAAGSL
jgi:hypothetical protein